MIDIILDKKLCTGSECGKCAYVCPNNVFTIKDHISITSPGYCKMCEECLKICPEAAIHLKTSEGILCNY
jgi:ferredoxin